MSEPLSDETIEKIVEVVRMAERFAESYGCKVHEALRILLKIGRTVSEDKEVRDLKATKTEGIH